MDCSTEDNGSHKPQYLRRKLHIWDGRKQGTLCCQPEMEVRDKLVVFNMDTEINLDVMGTQLCAYMYSHANIPKLWLLRWPGTSGSTTVLSTLSPQILVLKQCSTKESSGKASAYNAGDRVWSLAGEDPLEKEMATHSSTLACKIPWTEQSMGSQRVGYNWATLLQGK